jgi:tetratricopeptide (TPR) repeat protein
MENKTLFNAETKEQLKQFLLSEDRESISIIVGPEDSGKTQLLKWVAKEFSKKDNYLVFYHEIFPREYPSHFLCRFFLNLSNGLSLISSTVIWEDLKKQFPGEGEFFDILFDQDIRSFKYKILEFFNFIASSDPQIKILWIIDPRPNLEIGYIAAFFSEIKDTLPKNTGILIGQREGDILTRSQQLFSPFRLEVADKDQENKFVSQWCKGRSIPDNLISNIIAKHNSLLEYQLAIQFYDTFKKDFSSHDVSEMFESFYEKAAELGVSQVLDWLSLVPFFVPNNELSAISNSDQKRINSLTTDPFLARFFEKENNKIRIANNRLCSLLRTKVVQEAKNADDYLKKYFIYLFNEVQHRKEEDKERLKEDILRCSYILQNINDRQFFLNHYKGLFDAMRQYGLNDSAEDILKQSLAIQKELSQPMENQIELLEDLGDVQCKQANFSDAVSTYQYAQNISHQLEDKDQEAKFISREGEVFYLEGNTNKALEKHENALRLYKEVSNPQEMASEYSHIGKIYYAMKKFPEAEEHYKKAIQINQDLLSESKDQNAQEAVDLRRQIASLYSAFGHGYFSQDELDAALKNHQKSLTLFEELGDETFCTRQWGYLGHIQYANQKFHEAIEAYQKALDGYKKEKDRASEALILSSLGHVYLAMRNLDQSFKFHQESLDIHRELKNFAGEVNQLTNIGKLLQNQNKFNEARKEFKKATEITRKMHDKMSESVQFINLAELNLIEENPEKAHQNYQAALALTKEAGELYHQAEILVEIGQLMNSQQKYEEAETSFIEARRIFDENNYREKEALVVGHLGGLKRNQKKNEEALKYYQEGLAISKELNQNRGIAHFTANIGVIYYDKKDNQEALKHYNEALELYREIKDPEGTANTLSNMATVYYYQGDMDHAANKYEEALTIFRNIRNTLGVANLSRNVSYVYLKQERYDLAVNALQETIRIFERVGLHQEAQALKNEVEKIEKQAEESLNKLRKEIRLKADKKKKKVGRNDPCPCGSGKKYKWCCGA